MAMNITQFFDVAGMAGVSDLGDGTFRIDLQAGGSRAATGAEILAASKAYAVAVNRAEAGRRILAKYSQDRQRSAALGVYPTAYVEQMASDIAAVVQAENTAADAINAATTEAGVAAVTVNWPSI